MTHRILFDAGDITQDVLADVDTTWDGWFADTTQIDWDEFVDRLVQGKSYDIENMDSPAVRKIQRHVSKLRSEV